MTLEHLDTVISFVVIIAGVSLLITTLTQMVSALLSLGAPFWFSLLKTLSNLRPVVAQKAQPESAAGKADA